MRASDSWFVGGLFADENIFDQLPPDWEETNAKVFGPPSAETSNKKLRFRLFLFLDSSVRWNDNVPSTTRRAKRVTSRAEGED